MPAFAGMTDWNMDTYFCGALPGGAFPRASESLGPRAVFKHKTFRLHPLGASARMRHNICPTPLLSGRFRQLPIQRLSCHSSDLYDSLPAHG
jgi:hypothetical protein